jgi:hypothetical protein
MEIDGEVVAEHTCNTSLCSHTPIRTPNESPAAQLLQWSLRVCAGMGVTHGGRGDDDQPLTASGSRWSPEQCDTHQCSSGCLLYQGECVIPRWHRDG